jgi:hypothetical protein
MLLAALLGAAAWGAFVAFTAYRAHADIEAGRNQVRVIQNLSPSELIDGAAGPHLDAAEADFGTAASRLDNPALAPARWLPWAGRQLRSVTAMSVAARDGVVASADALDGLGAVLGDGLPAGPARPAALREVAATAADLRTRLDGLDLGPDHALIGKLADARTEFEREIGELDRTLGRIVSVAGGFADLLEGPHRYLVLAANNAQMQNGQGMFLDYGVLETAGGEITLSAFRDITELPRPAAAVPLEPDIAAAWPWMDPNEDWRHLGTSSRFPVTAATAQRLWAATGRPPVDGVLAVDPIALGAFLRLTGPIVADGRTFDADSVVSYLLHDQYDEFLAAGFTDERQLARGDRLRAVARAALDALARTADLDVEGTADLTASAGGRHLLAWSSEPAHQRAFEDAGIDGDVPPDGLLVSVVNRGGNKLDWFLDVTARVTVDSDTATATDHVAVTLDLHNRVDPLMESRYVAGPSDPSLAAGQYLGVVTLTIPAAAENATAAGGEVVVAGNDGDATLLGARVVVDPGARTTTTFRFDLPRDHPALEPQPSGRARPIEWQVSG